MAQHEECPECCCILEICCNAAEAQKAFADKLVAELGITEVEAARFVAWVHKDFVLAPKSFRSAMAEIAKMAHQHKP